jgi:hypothetical protein
MHQTMNAVLRVYFHQEMHVIRHHFQLEQLGTVFNTNILDNTFEPGVNPIDQHRAAVLWTPGNVILAGVDDVVI